MDIQKEREAFAQYFKEKHPELYNDVFDEGGDDRAIVGYSFAWSAWQAAKADVVHECTWSADQNEDMWGNWHTGCGEIFTLSEGTPSEHKLNHCCFCGGRLVEAQESAND